MRGRWTRRRAVWWRRRWWRLGCGAQRRRGARRWAQRWWWLVRHFAILRHQDGCAATCGPKRCELAHRRVVALHEFFVGERLGTQNTPALRSPWCFRIVVIVGNGIEPNAANFLPRIPPKLIIAVDGDFHVRSVASIRIRRRRDPNDILIADKIENVRRNGWSRTLWARGVTGGGRACNVHVHFFARLNFRIDMCLTIRRCCEFVLHKNSQGHCDAVNVHVGGGFAVRDACRGVA